MPTGRLKGTWKCRCAKYNRPGTTRCESCDRVKPSKSPKKSKPRSAPKPKAQPRETQEERENRKRREHGRSISNSPLALDIEKSVQKRLDEADD